MKSISRENINGTNTSYIFSKGKYTVERKRNKKKKKWWYIATDGIIFILNSKTSENGNIY